MNVKQKLLVPLFLAGVSAVAASAVSNGGFESVNKKADSYKAGLVKAGYTLQAPFQFPSSWRPGVNGIKDGFYKFPVAGVEGKNAIEFKGNIICSKFTGIKYADSVLEMTCKAKGNGGFFAYYLYSDSTFVGEVRAPIAASADWTDVKLSLKLPATSRGKKVTMIAIAFGSPKGMTIDAVKANVSSKTEAAAKAAPKKKWVKKGEIIDFVQGELKLPAKAIKTLKFKQKDNDTRQIRLVFQARIDWSTLSGYAPVLRLSCNGVALDGDRILNKPLVFKTRSGGGRAWGEKGSYYLMYSNDFSDAIQTNTAYIYGLYEKEQEPYRFVFDLTGLTKHVGENEVTLHATWLPLVFKDVYIEFDKEYQPRINDIKKNTVAPAPVGKLPDYTVRKIKPAAISIASAADKSIVMKAGPYNVAVATKLSMPNGKWLSAPVAPNSSKQVWKTPNYTMTRSIRKEATRIVVTDHFQNNTDKIVGVMVSNSVTLPGKAKRFLTAGRELVLSQFNLPGTNSTIITEFDKGAFAFVFEDDLLRNQGIINRNGDNFTFSDKQLALTPKGSKTLEWSIYYADGADYFDLINAIRMNWDVNFKLTGPFSFPYGGGTKGIGVNFWNNANEATVKKFLDMRKVKTIITHVPGNYSIPPNKATREKPYLGHGTALQDNWFTSWRNQTRGMTAALKKFAPDVEVHCYIHKNLCSEQGNRGKYNDSLPLKGGTYDKLSRTGVAAHYVPSRNNSYGKKLRETYLYMLDNLGTHIYMDEICLGVTATGKYTEWDESTVIIDPKTHEVKDTVSMPNLLQRPWMKDMMNELAKRNRKLIGNAPPVTKDLRDFKTIFFIEECMGESGLYSMHLSTPLGFCYKLGAEGFKHFKTCIEAGIVCFQYSDEFNTKLFPLTPMEVRKGYLIAKERIITGVSGVFGWDDKSDAELYVYNGKGELVKNTMIKKRSEGGKTVYEVRMPGDHLAVIVRK